MATGHPSRRKVLSAVGAVGMSGSLLAACGVKASSSVPSVASASGDNTVTIGLVSPTTGFAAGFGDVDPYVVAESTRALADGITVAGKRYPVRILLVDSKSESESAAAAARELIGAGADLVLASSTPETVNPVADVAEAAGVPCLSSVCPWEAFYFGRGATPDKPFRYTYHFFVGVAEAEKVYQSLWLHGVETNKVLGVLWPGDVDGKAFRTGMTPLLTKAGLKIVDPGAFPSSTRDFTSIIAKFRSADVQVINSVATPPVFAAFWKQAAQQGFRPRIATVAKTGLLPAQVEALGALGPGLTVGVYWHPTWPTSSAILGRTSQQIADGYTETTGKQWTQNLGTTAALLEVAVAALKASGNPKDREAVAKAMSTLSVDTVVGRLDWNTGPVPNVAVEPLVGGKWVRTSGGPFPLSIQIVENSGYPQLPVQVRDTPLQ